MLWPIRLWLWSAGVLILRLFYLFGSRDNAIHPQGICGLRNTKETSLRPSASRLQLQRNPPTWAVRCAQVSGYEPPLQKSVKKESKQGESKLSLAPRGCSFHRLLCHPLIHPRGMSSILVRSISHHPSHPDSSRNFTYFIYLLLVTTPSIPKGYAA
jgi:hypothetical protein